MAGKKGRGSGPSVVVATRVKAGGAAYIERTARRYGMDRGDYLRGLIAAEYAANQKGRSLFIPGWTPESGVQSES